MFSVFYRNRAGQQCVANWFGEYSRFIVNSTLQAIAMTHACYGRDVQILSVIRWHESHDPKPFASVVLA